VGSSIIISCQQYCHSTLGWTNFSVGSNVCLTNVVNTGYRVTFAGSGTISGIINACDTNIASPAIASDSCSGLSPITLTITDVNYGTDYNFSGQLG
jgi:hypothetical protein